MHLHYLLENQLSAFPVVYTDWIQSRSEKVSKELFASNKNVWIFIRDHSYGAHDVDIDI